MQTTQNILLVRPSNFSFNTETATSNVFQKISDVENNENVKKNAIIEFDSMVQKLKSKGVSVYVFEDTLLPSKPDAVFPNNWVTFHADGTVVLYPMFAPNRRLERRLDIIDRLRQDFLITTLVDFSEYEEENKFLEGTGSIVFDHLNKVAYASISSRTDKELFLNVCSYLKYKPVCFHSFDANGKEIYHTNVMMCVGDKFAIVCKDVIHNMDDQHAVIDTLMEGGHQIIDISLEQMKCFGGNMLQVLTGAGKTILVMSETAFNSLTEAQRNKLGEYAELLPCAIETIETIGGGSARCMMAEIFLPS